MVKQQQVDPEAGTTTVGSSGPGPTLCGGGPRKHSAQAYPPPTAGLTATILWWSVLTPAMPLQSDSWEWSAAMVTSQLRDALLATPSFEQHHILHAF